MASKESRFMTGVIFISIFLFFILFLMFLPGQTVRVFVPKKKREEP
jgi:Na+-transporting methylmalonyl-CoA/oxaloacetate decarboxylase gamma subunit